MLSPHSPKTGRLTAAIATPDLGQAIYARAAGIFPICRSITGSGVRQTLHELCAAVPLSITEIPTGTQLFDWNVPEEWTFRDAFIADKYGHRLIDARLNNLHVMSYSVPVDAVMSRDELAAHIHTLPNQPDLIPYRTSYYAPKWAFCLSERQWQSLPEGPYRVCIDTTLAPGHLTYGEYTHHGLTGDEVVLSAHICHPSLANDNCSGLAVLTALAEHMRPLKTRYTYRFVFAPGTIGALAWLSRNEHQLSKVKAGLVVSCLGDGGGPNYKKTRRGDALIDRAFTHICQSQGPTTEISDFSPYGYDERQFCSPGFNLPVGSLQRSRWGTFPEYHTSADNISFIQPEHLAASAGLIANAIDILEDDWRPLNLSPKGEPQLGHRGLYAPTADANMAMLWVLNMADGTRSLLDIAERSKLPFARIAEVAAHLKHAGLLADATT